MKDLNRMPRDELIEYRTAIQNAIGRLGDSRVDRQRRKVMTKLLDEVYRQLMCRRNPEH